MPRIDSEKFYTSAIDKYGVSPQGLNWSSKEAQELRFEVISKLLPKEIISIVDAGCGFGDFYHFMKKNHRLPEKYIGIDILPRISFIAKQNTNQEIISANILQDTLPYADYYVCSGTMNILNTFETHLFIRKCYEASKIGFIFNILYGEKESDTYNYVSKPMIQEIATNLGVTRIQRIDDYIKNDITIGFFHV